jgi:hypothetical protein
MKPEFTETEKFVIAHAKSNASGSDLSAIWPDILCVIGALVFAGAAYYTSDLMWLIVSFIILVWHILRNAFAMKTYGPVYRSIFDKYDAAIEELAEDKN